MMFTAVFRKAPRRGGDEGAVGVEAAIVLSLLLALIFGIVEFGFGFLQWNTMLLAVEQAGRYVMINNATCGTSCAVTQMQAVLTTATGCTAPTTPGQMCVSACMNPDPTKPFPMCVIATPVPSPQTLRLTASYRLSFVALFNPVTMTRLAPLTLTRQVTVPLD
jgi:Flp pilus assembly protein TadG